MHESRWVHVMCVALLGVSAAHADPKPVATTGMFTVKSILGTSPTKDQVRVGEAANWKMAFGKCPESAHQPPLRIGDPRTTVKDNVSTLEMDFECGSCGGGTCPAAQYCVEMTTATAVVHATCEAKPPAATVAACTNAAGYGGTDHRLRCSPLAKP